MAQEPNFVVRLQNMLKADIQFCFIFTSSLGVLARATLAPHQPLNHQPAIAHGKRECDRPELFKMSFLQYFTVNIGRQMPKGRTAMNDLFLSQILTDPDRLEVRDSENQRLTTFTLGSYTVTLHGPARTFSEQDASVTHTTWVRTLPTPFDGQLDTDWLEQALEANQQQVPDILAIAMQYIKGAPAVLDEDGLQIAGDAGHEPEEDGKRQEGADFNDYLGIDWQYEAGELDKPEPEQFRCLDCSGFMRMVWGYRHNFSGSDYADAIPLSLKIEPGVEPRYGQKSAR